MGYVRLSSHCDDGDCIHDLGPGWTTSRTRAVDLVLGRIGDRKAKAGMIRTDTTSGRGTFTRSVVVAGAKSVLPRPKHREQLEKECSGSKS